MKKTISALLLSLYFSFLTPAEAAGTGMPNLPNKAFADLASRIGSTMFALYQLNYQEQVTLVPTLKYCGYKNAAQSMIDSFPDISLFYKKYSPQQAIYDMVIKEAMQSDVELASQERFDSISKQSIICAQSYFQGYIKGYQMALETMFNNKKIMEPFCEAAVADAAEYIRTEYSAIADR